MLVFRTGVAELRYVDEQGEVVGEPVDVFLAQDTIPTEAHEIKAFFQKDMITKKQATFYCNACLTYVNNLNNMKDHCNGKKHKTNISKLEFQEKLEYNQQFQSVTSNQPPRKGPRTPSPPPPPQPLMDINVPQPLMDVNPYHQAWAETAEDCLTLVSGPGVAEFRIENKTVDAYDFQQVHKVIPPGFFKRSVTGNVNSFYCIVCDLSLNDPFQIKSHCAGKEHLKNGMTFSRNKTNVSPAKTKVKNATAHKSLISIMLSSEEPCIGLEHIEEWFDSTDQEPPIYTCNICEVWGHSDIMYNHIINESHRRKHLTSRFPVLEKMISGMDRIELLERAQEEEEKIGGFKNRNYQVIKQKTDDIKYAALKRMARGPGNPLGNPIHAEEISKPTEAERPGGSLKQDHPNSWQQDRPSSLKQDHPDSWQKDPPNNWQQDRPDSWQKDPPNNWQQDRPGAWQREQHHDVGRRDSVGHERGAFGDRGRGFHRGRGGYNDQSFGRGGFDHDGGRGRGFKHQGRGFVDRGRGFRGRGFEHRGQGWRGGGGFGRGGWENLQITQGFGRGGGGGGRGGRFQETGEGPLYGRKMNGQFEKLADRSRGPPTMKDEEMFEQTNNPFILRKDEMSGYADEDDPPDAYYAVSGDQEDYGYGERKKEKDKERDETTYKVKDVKDTSAFRDKQYPKSQFENRFGDQDDRSYRGFRDRNDFEDKKYQLENRMRQHYSNTRYYGPGTGQKETVIHEIRSSSRDFGRDYIMSRGTRPERYYGPEGDYKDSKTRDLIYNDDGDDKPYEGPTIFDKVFRSNSRKTSTEDKLPSSSRSRSGSTSPDRRRSKSKSRSAQNRQSQDKSRGHTPDRVSAEDIEAEFIKYKEKTEAKIRREKEKLMKYEKKLKELTKLSQNDTGRLKPLDIEKYERKKRKLEESASLSPRSSSKSRRYADDDPPPPPPAGSPPPGLPFEPPRHLITPPPGTNLKPVLTPEGDGEISEDEYDTRYSEFVSRSSRRLSPEAEKPSKYGHSPENDSYENKLDPY